MPDLIATIAQQAGRMLRRARRVFCDYDVKMEESVEEHGSRTPDKKNYTLKEAAIYLNVSTRTVERLLQRKLLRRNQALRKILIPRTELDAFLLRTL